MHLEFKSDLEVALSKLLSREIELPWDAVVDPPENLPWQLSSNLAFSFCKESFTAEHLSRPSDFAEALIAELKKQAEEKYDLEMGGGGHINAALKEPFKLRLLNAALAKDGFSRLRSYGSLLSAEPGAAFPALSVELESVVKSVKKEFSSTRDYPDFPELLEKCLLSGLDGVWLLLALRVDKELEYGVFLRGLNGRENIPWYFSKFERDATVFAERARKSLSLDPEQTMELSSKALSSPLIGPLAERVLGFRRSYLLAVQHRRADILLKFLLDSVRSIYAVYNRPQIRALELPQSELYLLLRCLECFSGFLAPLKNMQVFSMQVSAGHDSRK